MKENISENQITIVDVKIPSLSVVIFMVKAAIAAIPAFIILAIIGAIIMGVMGDIMGGEPESF